MATPKKKSDLAGKSDPASRKKSSATRKTAKQPQNSSAGLDAIELLEDDHRTVDGLFDQYREATSDAAKRSLAIAICTSLKVHAKLEEDLFYPAAASAGVDADLLQEAQVEHASAKDLISQIETGAPGEALFDARIKVLGEYVRHHVEEEESEIFPLCRKSGADLKALGQLMALRKQELMLGLLVSNPIQGLD